MTNPWIKYTFSVIFFLLLVDAALGRTRNVSQNYSINRRYAGGGSWVYMGHEATRINRGDNVNGIPLGFDFPFYDQTFNRVNISPHGWISFTQRTELGSAYDSRPTYYPFLGTMPSSTYGGDLITPYIFNFDFRQNGGVYYRRERDRFTVAWINAYQYLYVIGPHSFQAQLYDNGTIVFSYRMIPGNYADRTTTAGIQISSRIGLTVFAGRTTDYNAPRSGEIVILTPPGVSPPPRIFRAPDLVIERVMLDPPRPAPGQLIRVRVTVRNRGTTPSGGGRVALWSNRSTTTGGEEDAAALIGRLEPGRWRVVSFNLRHNVRAPIEGGTYTCRIVVDHGNVIRESDETNNTLSLPYQVVRQNAIANGEDFTVDARRGGVRYFYLQVPRDQMRFIASTRNGRGDPDLYVKRGSQPTRRDFTWTSRNSGPEERIVIDRPAPGTYFSTVDARQAFGNVIFNHVYD